MRIDDVKNSLDQNEFLTEEFKNNLFELILIFEKNYPKVALDTLIERLKTVKFEVVSKYISDEAVLYNNKINTLQINQTELEKSGNIKHLLMIATLYMTVEDAAGENGLLDGFRKGFSEILANNLVGGEE